jgi:hypothetical protein
MNSPCREQWLKRLRSNYHLRPYFLREIPRQFSILHVAGEWGVPALVDYVSRSNDQECESGNLTRFINFDCVDASG